VAQFESTPSRSAIPEAAENLVARVVESYLNQILNLQQTRGLTHAMNMAMLERVKAEGQSLCHYGEGLKGITRAYVSAPYGDLDMPWDFVPVKSFRPSPDACVISA
jgi:hypothetical protein